MVNNDIAMVEGMVTTGAVTYTVCTKSDKVDTEVGWVTVTVTGSSGTVVF